MNKVKYIGEPTLDNPSKYGKYAKELIEIIYEQGSGDKKKYRYLDEPGLLTDVINYYTDLSREKNKINGKYLGKRVKYNAIMLGIAAAVFFTGIGLGNIMMSLGINQALVYYLMLFSTAIINTYGFIHVNKPKFYYKKGEFEKLQRIKSELEKCSSIEQKINSLDKDQLLNIDFKREQIDNRDLRERNLRRNYQMQVDFKEQLNISRERVNRGVVERLKTNPKITYEEIPEKKLSISDNIYRYKSKMKLTTKRLGRNIGKWFVEAFQDDEPPKTEENYFIRGERRR